MITPFVTHVDIESLALSAGACTGTISVRVGQIVFPNPQWSDFPLIILGWWLSSLADLRKGRRKTVRCRFMDGPFWFDLRVRNGDLWDIQLVRSGCCDECVGNATVLAEQVTDSVLAISERLLAECARRAWRTSEVEALSAIYLVLHSTEAP